MAKLHIDGRELRVVTLGTARNRDIIELQLQSGYKIGEIQDRAQDADFFGQVVISFLTQVNAGFSPKFDTLLDGNFEVLGKFVPDAADDAAKAEAEAEANPTLTTDLGTLAPADTPDPAPTPE